MKRVYLQICTVNKLRKIYYKIMQQLVLDSLREPRLVQLFLHCLLLFIIAVVLTAGVCINADGRLDRIVAQEHLCVLVQIIETSGLWPEQSV